jgi:BRCA1-associated protein
MYLYHLHFEVFVATTQNPSQESLFPSPLDKSSLTYPEDIFGPLQESYCQGPPLLPNFLNHKQGKQEGKQKSTLTPTTSYNHCPNDYRTGPLSMEWMDLEEEVDAVKPPSYAKVAAAAARERNVISRATTLSESDGDELATAMASMSTSTNYEYDHILVENVASSSKLASPAPRTPQRETARTATPYTTPAKKGHIVPTSGAFLPFKTKSGSTQLNAGVLHLYRDKTEVDDILETESIEIPDPKQSSSELASIKGCGTILCVLAVPSYMSSQDFLNFIGPSRKVVSHIRIVRDSFPNRYMVLIKFRNSKAADTFYRQYTGKPFNSLDPEVCHVVYIKSIEFKSQAIPPYAFPPIKESSALSGSNPPCSTNDRHSTVDSTMHSSTKKHLIELPVCPVCLDRMDATVTGLVTIVCHHTFHCHCLSKWGDSSCPVCRYTQKESIEDSDSLNECSLCGTTENLWICLICGNIGCGRYKAAHAARHYSETNHLYSLELETQRVWDYAGDNYVHRLIQNKSDGKLVELPPPTSGQELRPMANPNNNTNAVNQDKLDSIGLEYTYLLTSQLESQRMWYEARLAEIQQTSATQLSELSSHINNIKNQSGSELASILSTLACIETERDEARRERNELKLVQIPNLTRDRKTLEKRLEKTIERLAMLEREYEEEREINDALRKNQDNWKAQLDAREKDLLEKNKLVDDLNEQVRDLMFFLETQKTVDQSPLKEELQNGTVVLEEKPPLISKRRGKRR